MKPNHFRAGEALAMAAVLCMAASGCGQKTIQKPAATPAVLKVSVPLPEWAPKNPSPEFLRAARVLKPLPDEALQPAAGEAPAGMSAILQRYRGTFLASYEFFGALDDLQIERFRATKEVRIPVQSLTAKQRAELGHWFENYCTVMKGTGPEFEDYLSMIYKMGGREDLSNVEVGFLAPGGKAAHIVHIYFWVRMPDGKVNDFGTAFAQI
jgi:hypothetical protein